MQVKKANTKTLGCGTWRRHVRKEQSMLIALAAARTGSGHLVVELVMPFVAGRRLGDAPFYAY